MVKAFTLGLALLLSGSFVFADNNAIPSDKAPLSDDFILYLQIERTLRRENLIRHNEVAVPTPGRQAEKQQAEVTYRQALKTYANGEYAKARAQFEEVLPVLPDSDQIYFDYGKCLYRQGAYRMALSVFMMLDNNPDFSSQSEFYQAMSLYKLKNYDLASRKFNNLSEDKNGDLAPMSAFYAGQIDYRLEHFPAARKHFEFVLDHSKDPQMDDSAEKYLDQITLQEKLNQKLSNRFGYNLNIGLIYDQNVLNISQQNSSTSLEAYRASYGGSLFYRVMNQADQQLSPTLAFSDLYSLNRQFKNDTLIQSTDPFILDFTLPYSLNFTIDKKYATFFLAPGFEQIYMTKSSTTREVVFNNMMVNSGLTFAHSKYLTTSYKLFLSNEQSTFIEVAPEDEQSTQKQMATVSNYYLLDKPSNANAIFELSYLINKAQGVNVRYNKFLVSLGYTQSLTPTINLFIKSDYSSLNYSDSTTGRKDISIVGYVGGGYSLTSYQTINLGLQYQNNQSSLDTFSYSKFILTCMYSLTSF